MGRFFDVVCYDISAERAYRMGTYLMYYQRLWIFILHGAKSFDHIIYVAASESSLWYKLPSCVKSEHATLRGGHIGVPFL